MPARRTLLIATALGLSLFATRPRAETSSKIARVGILSPVTPASLTDVIWTALREGLRERGWLEGGNIIYEIRGADFSRLPSAASELVALNVDVILASGALAALAAKNTSSRIPIVFWADDPIGRGIVSSLSQPGANATGIARQGAETYAKRIELLRQVLPNMSRVAMLVNPEPGGPPGWQQLVPRGIEVFPVDVRSAEDLSPAFAMIATRQADAVLVGDNYPMWHLRTEILERLANLRLPAVFSNDLPWVKLGGLLSFGPDGAVLMRQIINYVDKILRGAKPADLPVEQPVAFEIGVNLKTAKSLGITVPRELLVRAKWIVE